MKFIGITGGVGAGKSEILKYLGSREDTRVMLADEIARTLCEPGQRCNEKLQQIFAGDQVFDAHGNMDRGRMAAVIFADGEKRRQMNEIVHPAVKEYVLEQYRIFQENDGIRYLFLEAALLIEEHYDEICHELWYIYTSRENRRKRLIASRGYSDGKIDEIFASQLSEEEYRSHCVRVIDNNGTTDETISQVEEILKILE
ncbi:MAG: dephospho-CoA kinase [Roseburia sp.]